MTPQSQERKLRKYLKDLTKTVKICINALDDAMKRPSDENRGKLIAKVLNDLEMANDCARHFGLGEKL